MDAAHPSLLDTGRSISGATSGASGTFCPTLPDYDDRWFLDRIATHILAFEGDSKITFFDGNFSEYEEWRKQTLGDAATRPHRITYRKLTR